MAEYYTIAEILNSVYQGDSISTFSASADVLNAVYDGTSALKVSLSGSTGGGGVWGDITGTLSSQTDLDTALGLKADKSTTYTETEVDNLLSPKLDESTFNTYSGTTDTSISDLEDDKADKNITITTKSASYEVDADDNGTMINFSDTATVTLPDGMDTGYQVVIVNVGSTKTITLSATTTLQSTATTITKQYGGATCTHLGSNVWLSMGLLE